MLQDIRDSIKAKLYDFAYTPFMSSFVVSWIILNHKYLLIYFGDGTLADKSKLLDAYEFGSYIIYGQTSCSYQLGCPVLIALIYVFIYPAFALGFYFVTLFYKKWSKWVKQKIEDETPIPQEEAREIRREIARLTEEKDEALNKLSKKEEEYEGKLQASIEPLTTENERLKGELAQKDENIKSLGDERDDLNKKLSQVNSSLAAKMDEYDALEKKKNNFGLELNDLAVANEPLKKIHEEKPSQSSEDDKTKVLKFFYTENYKPKQKPDALDAIVNKTKIARPKVEKIVDNLSQEGILSIGNAPYQVVSITSEGNDRLIEMFDEEWER